MRIIILLYIYYTYVQSLEWYDHPESRKYLLFEFNPSTTTNNTTSALTNPSSSSTTSMAPQDSHSIKHILSPRSPGATPSQKPLAHINSLAQQEVEYALKDFEITVQVGGVRTFMCLCVRVCEGGRSLER